MKNYQYIKGSFQFFDNKDKLYGWCDKKIF